MKHEVAEREVQAAKRGACAEWDLGWTLEVNIVFCSASLAWPEKRVDLEVGDRRPQPQPMTRGQSPF